jgi:hypothetical protein
VANDHDLVFVDHDWLLLAEPFNAVRNVIDLLLGMLFRILGIRDQFPRIHIFDLHF